MLKDIIESFNSIKYKYLFTTLILFLSFSFLTIYIWNSRMAVNEEKSTVNYMSEMLRVSNQNFEIATKDIYELVSIASINNENIVSVLTRTNYTSEKEQLADNLKVDNFLSSQTSFKYYLNGIMAANLSGNYFISGSSMSYADIQKQKWYETIVKFGDKKIIIPPYNIDGTDISKDTNYNNLVLSIARPVINANSVVGFVKADIRCNILNDLFTVNLKNKGTVFLFDNSTDELVFKPTTNSGIGDISKSELKTIQNKLKSNQGSFYTKINNIDTLVIFNYSSYINWTAIGLIPKATLLEGLKKTQKDTFTLSIIFCFIGVFITYLISYFLTKNIRNLNLSIKALDKGNLDISLDIKSNDEVGQLSHQFNLMVIRIKDLINDIKRNEKEKRKAETRALLAQINPHFLYNTLNTIKFLALLQGADNIKSITESLSELLYTNLDNREFITLEEEVSYIKNYLSIQEYKYHSKFTVNIILQPGLEHFMILKLLLQPLVENSLIHGIAPIKGQGSILIKILQIDSVLKITIQDNGIGMSEEKISEILRTKEHSSGIGLQNVISRINLNFGKPYGLNITSYEDVYTEIEISHPLILENEVGKYD